MKFPWFVLGFLLLQAQVLPAQQNLNAVRTTAEEVVPFELESGFLILVEGRIGPLQPLKFLLDTGATETVVDSKIADKLFLQRQKGQVFNFNRFRKVEWAVLPEVQVGPIKARNLRIMVGDLKQYSEFARNVDAVIGLDVLRMSASLQIDYAAKRLVFKSAGKGGLPQPETPQALTVRLLVQGQPIRLVIDSGLQGILLYQDRLRKRPLQLKLTDKVAQAHQGRLTGESATLSGVRLGPDEFQATVFFISGAPDSLPADIDGYLGSRAMNANLVELDFEANTLRWK